MRSYATPEGPFAEGVYYTEQEIDDICADELRRVGLMPKSPEPIRIDRFVEKRFKVVPTYEDLPTGLLGLTRFSKHGVEEMVISKSLADEGTKIAECRINSTIAHESGHAILQIQLFVLDTRSNTPRLVEDGVDLRLRKITCRTEAVGDGTSRGYDGRWWEVQANRAIGALLLPRQLVRLAVQDIAPSQGVLGTQTLPPEMRAAAVQILVEAFDVNPAVARIRVDQLFPVSKTAQLTL